ncbi:MAG TPA: histidine phosphatase family protein [Thermomicrobiales bacterium]|nr:histidine phosphatase family protein [Thermomicrobiales bacterium]
MAENGSVILVRHAQPVIVPDRPTSTWALADGARQEIEALAASIRDLSADGVVASPQVKAHGTGEVIAGFLGLPLESDDAFREQGGDTEPFLPDADFRAAVAAHFARPDDVVFGSESSTQAARRFAEGIDRACAAFRLPVVVTHGRVMCGYLASALGIDPLPVWRDLRLPDAYLIDLDDGTLVRIEA